MDLGKKVCIGVKILDLGKKVWIGVKKDWIWVKN